jgi:hypothetical protein
VKERINKDRYGVVALFTYVRKMYFRFGLHNRLEEHFSVFVIYYSLKVKIDNLL